MDKFEILKINVQDFVFNHKVPRFVVLIGNRLLGILAILIRILTIICIIIWVLGNNGHVKVDEKYSSILGLSIKGGFSTNYTQEDFNETYVKPDEWQKYNRVWDYADFVERLDTEVQVTTNMVITENQTKSTCPELSLLQHVQCDPFNNTCEKGVMRTHGIQTGNCVPADFPYKDPKTLEWKDISVCEISGLKNYNFLADQI